MQQHLLFLAASHGVDHLLDALHGGVARRDLDGLGVAQQTIGQLANFIAEGGREQQALLVLGHQRQNLLDVMDEAHVQHAVGLVQDQHLDGGQIHEALTGQVQQTAGRGNQNVHAFFDAGDLRFHADTAKNHRRGDV